MPLPQKSKAPAIDYSVQILDLLASSSTSLTLTEIYESTGISPASVHRIIQSMLEHQLIAIDPVRKKSYCVGSRIFQIASNIYNKQSIIPHFYPIAEILKNEIHTTIFLSVPIGNKVVIVAKLENFLQVMYDIFIGKTQALHLAAAGQAILSMRDIKLQENYFKAEQLNSPDNNTTLGGLREELAKTKRLGYAVTQEDVTRQLNCIAAPILNLRNEPVAAISAAIESYQSPQTIRSYSKNLIQAARQLSSRII